MLGLFGFFLHALNLQPAALCEHEEAGKGLKSNSHKSLRSTRKWQCKHLWASLSLLSQCIAKLTDEREWTYVCVGTVIDCTLCNWVGWLSWTREGRKGGMNEDYLVHPHTQTHTHVCIKSIAGRGTSPWRLIVSSLDAEGKKIAFLLNQHQPAAPLITHTVCFLSHRICV